MSARAPGLAFALGTLLALLGAGEARAAALCTNTPGPSDIVSCIAADGVSGILLVNASGNIDINLVNQAIASSPGIGVRGSQHGSMNEAVSIRLRGTTVNTVQGGAGASGVVGSIENTTSEGALTIDVTGGAITTGATSAMGVYGYHSGAGDIDIDVTRSSVTTAKATGHGFLGYHLGTGGDVDIDMTGGTVTTAGKDAHGIYGYVANTASAGALTIDVTGGASIKTTGDVARGVHGYHRGTGGIDVDLTDDSSVTTAGKDAHGVYGYHLGTGDVDIGMTGGSVTTAGVLAHGFVGYHYGASGDVDIDLTGGTVRTAGEDAMGVWGYFGNTESAGALTIGMTGGTSIKTTGEGARGVYGYHRGSGGIDVDMMDGSSVTTAGEGAYGVYGYRTGAGGIDVVVTDGSSVTTTGDVAHGVLVYHVGAGGDVDIDMTGSSVTTVGEGAHGVWGYIRNTASEGALRIAVTGGAVTAEGLRAHGLYGLHRGLGSVSMTTGAAAEVESPFFRGLQGRLLNNANAAGRLLVTHRGAVRARDAGILAWAFRSSGHTFGDGAQTADDAARDAPMVHVISSGEVTVGASVTDAFIREAVAGADETLSAAENAVLSAVTAGDSDALDTALDALPAAYGDEYKARARNLLSQRGDAPSSAAALAYRAAEEILGLSRAGVRAVALSHSAVADHVRRGDRDPAILAIAAAARTEQQRATLAEQEKLSAAERTVLEAALTGSGLETALAALPGAAYTDDWKDGVRQRAASYNAGDVQVDVTGGAITAEGNGVEALYAVPHERNGAITVSVSEGARVTGGASGVYVRGAGATGGVRSQSVTVNGQVRGGTGAGVHLAGGGRLTVGRAGRVGATSGMGVLSDGAGDLHATVAGTVDGDVQARGGGELRLNVAEGGTVTGTAHDPAGPLTVAGRIGRLLYTSGATVTVARTGALTGVEVEGKTQALHSAAGDLDVTVSGQVAGDLRAPRGGTLKLAVREGGTITGTVHDPAGPLTVAGRIGRLLYTSGGTVTVARTGALTGIEGETEALRSAAGDLDLSVAGRVTGDVRARGDGDLTATVAGTLTGDLIEEGDGDLSATISGTVDGDVRSAGSGALRLNLRQGGTVTGTVHDPVGPLTVAGRIGRLLYTNGATVTVARTGALTGVEVGGKTEALRSEAGDLALRVAGSVTGDIRAEGDGDLDATISGTLTGDILGLGAGEHVVTVSKGGTVRGTIDLGASTVGVDGRAGRVRFDQGGTVTVGGTGWITGIEGVAIRNKAGGLVVSVADGGRVTGDIIDLGARPARVTIGPGSRVEGSIDVAAAGSELRVGGTVTGGIDMAGAGSELRVDGTVEGRLRYHQGGMVTVGPDGKVEGGASSDRGKIVAVVERKPEETDDEARERAFPGFPDSVVEGVEEEGGGRTPTIKVEPEVVELAREHEPRMRVYEALPSVVLGLNGLRGYGERMAVPRSAKGGWARVERFQGKWKADASASGKESGVGLRYRHQRHGVEVGLGGALGEEARIGASLHHRRGTAKVSEGGDVELYGTGAGVSGTWMRAGDYVDVQAAMTWYEADLRSSRRGVLRKDVSGFGHALGVEAGRRMELEGLPAGVVLIPRVGLVHSQVSMDGFSDVTGARVRVEDARSLRGRAGVDVETKPGGAAGSRVFGSVEVEHELSTGRTVRVSGTERVSGMELESEAEATWLRLGLNGVHTWEEGRYTVQGGVGYATSGGSHELGGGVSLNLRF